MYIEKLAELNHNRVSYLIKPINEWKKLKDFFRLSPLFQWTDNSAGKLNLAVL